MAYRQTLPAARWGRSSVALLLVGLAGCAMVPPNSFIDPTKVGRFGGEPHESGVRQVLTPRDTPPGLAHATEPTPDDLVATFNEYRLEAGDVVAITVQDLLMPGQPFAAALEVNVLGEVRLPDLGTVRVAGLTEQEVEQEVMARLKEAGLLPKPVVVATVQLKRGRTFSIVGAVTASGTYPIPQPDMRLLDAIGAVGDVSPTARKAYVIRRSTAESGMPGEPAMPPAPPIAPEKLVVPPPMESSGASGALSTSVGLARHTQEASPASQEPPSREELSEVLTPGKPGQPATRGAREPSPAPFEPLVFDPETGQVMGTQPQTAPAAPPSEGAPVPEAKPLDEPFDWEDVPESGFDQRVIAIDLTELKAGNPRQNIVVRDRDVINVPIDTGVFYMMGEITRPGVYAFGGREITIKQAMAITGGFTPLAWPQRTEVIRREPGTDKQTTIPVNLDAIWAGLEEDFYLRDDDIVNVGTHIVAPFLFVIRNSFRFTYGFGFVYDRNFADKDSYAGRSNPEAVRQARRAARGLPF